MINNLFMGKIYCSTRLTSKCTDRLSLKEIHQLANLIRCKH